LEAGADDFISKPFREEVLFEKLEALLGVRYVSEEEKAPTTSVPPPSQRLALRGQVATLPAALLTDLRQATLAADLDRILGLCEQADVHSPELAQELRRLAEGFAYENLLAMLDGGEEEG